MALAVQILFAVTLVLFIGATIFGLLMLNKLRKDKRKGP